ncbi:hypothetical protein [Mucilaginibacter psychrotolerans]|uniref:Uncharacterized protein n=1 Tax=Mucilaginibacter psychrotolerans TaxID=1524096 RepID=A0A4Y8S7N8_9SPHI|nr:hypothetical protein [Mucilaginibacter psychrotolerans]TFF35043.1 hypothetical protein E2R66_20075 [Mucilaginibacter psychrotolerans]
MRYLTSEQLSANLSLGKSVEQWLAPKEEDTYVVLRWLRIDKEKDLTYTTCYIECFDEGDEQFADIYEFSPIDPDEPEVLNNFASADEAILFVKDAYAASLDKFVNAGLIQDEYRNFIMKKG